MSLHVLAAALRAAADVLETSATPESAPVAEKPAKASKKAPAATVSTPPAQAATPAAPVVTQTPVTESLPAQSPPAAPTYPKIETVNAAITALASMNRKAAVDILTKFGVSKSPELKKEQYQAVIDEMEEKKAQLDAAAAQASLV